AGEVPPVLYDGTTLCCEAPKEDALRKGGLSQERRVDPQIVVGLLVDRTGFPLEIGCYEGNHAETRTIVPMIKQFQDRPALPDIALVGDAGMLALEDLTSIHAVGLLLIVGPTSKNAPRDSA